MRKFYILSNAHLRGELVIDSPQIANGYGFFRGELAVETPVHIVKHMGNKLFDYLAGSFYGVQLFHNRLFEALHNEDITGFESLPAIIKLKDRTVEDYSCLIVKGRCAGMDFYKGDIIEKGPIVPGGSSYIVEKGIYFDEKAWDGSDIFLFEGMMFVVVTEKVKLIFDKLAITNIICKETVDYEIEIDGVVVSRPELKKYYLSKLNDKS